MPEASSPTSRVLGQLPEGVDPAELYDGPVPGEPQAPAAQPEKVVPMRPLNFTAPAELVRPIPPPSDRGVNYGAQVSPTQPTEKSYPAVLTAALDVLSARLLGLLAVLAACLMWGFAVYDPNTLRTVAASLFSVTVLLPIVVLYWRAGMTGDGG